MHWKVSPLTFFSFFLLRYTKPPTPSVTFYRHLQPVIFVMHFTQYKKIHHIYKEWNGNCFLLGKEICYWKPNPPNAGRAKITYFHITVFYNSDLLWQQTFLNSTNPTSTTKDSIICVMKYSSSQQFDLWNYIKIPSSKIRFVQRNQFVFTV